MNDDELRDALVEAAYLEGDFVLRSGKRSSFYFDKYRFETRPDLLAPIGERIAAIVAEHENGAALAGCSAGAMALSDWAPRMRDLVHPNQPTGLRLVQQVRVIPHFDKMLGWMPDMLRNALLHTPSDSVLLGIDEDTALVGGPHEWTVQGRQSVWVLSEGSRVEYAAGATLTTP